MAKTYDWDPDLILGQAPRTNVGIVPMEVEKEQWGLGKNLGKILDRQRDQLGWKKLPPTYETQYVAPRDPRVKDLLGYSAYENVEGVPQLGIKDQLMPRIRSGTEVMYDRPEELEFDHDPNQPVPGGVYNTELNPYNPSSKFFPWDPDYSGLMSLAQYTEDIGDVKEMPLVSELIEDEYGRGHSKLVPKDPSYGYYEPWNRNITFNPWQHEEGDIEEMRDTLLHEGKHYFIDQYGDIIPKAQALSDHERHDAIYFADMFRKNPNYYGSKMTLKDKDTALAFMEMHNKAKKLYQSGKDPGESKAERLIREKYGTLEQGELMDAGRKALGQTAQQKRAQERMMTYAQRGDVTAAPYGEEMQRYEATRSGGTVNPREMTKAAAREHVAKQKSEKRKQRTKSRGAQRRQPRRARERAISSPAVSRPSRSRPTHHFSQGGLVSIDYLTRRL